MSNFSYEQWEYKPNQRKTLVYYTGVEGGNPSGAVTNVKYINYEHYDVIDSIWNIVLTQLIEYNGNDYVISITPIKN